MGGGWEDERRRIGGPRTRSLLISVIIEICAYVTDQKTDKNGVAAGDGA
jgi:hypothetical protein